MARLKVKREFNTDEEVYLTHVRIIDALMGNPLTKKEVEVLAYFLTEGKISKKSKERIAVKHKMSLASINNIVRNLKVKGVIKEDGISKIFRLPDTDEVKYLIYVRKKQVNGTD